MRRATKQGLLMLALAALAPAGTPPEIINRLHAELIRAVGQPDVQEIFVRLGFEVMTSTPAEFARLIRADLARLAKVVREAGIPLELFAA